MEGKTFRIVQLTVLNFGAQLAIESEEKEGSIKPQYSMTWSISLVFKTWSGTFITWQG